MLTAVVVHGLAGETMGLREVGLRFTYDPPQLDAVLQAFAGINHRLLHPHSKPEAERWEGIRNEAKQAVLKFQGLALGAVHSAVDGGLLVLEGIQPGYGAEHRQVDITTIREGDIDVMAESITDYRTNHRERYWSLRLRPTTERMRAGMPQRTEAATRADEFKAVAEQGDHVKDVDGTWVILRTKRDVHKQLSTGPWGGLFGTLGTFNKYDRVGDGGAGRWADELWRHHRIEIRWGCDSNMKGYDE